MATQDKSTISGGHDVNQRNIRTIVSGMVSVVDVLEHHNYTIPDYLVKKVELIHVKLKDDDNRGGGTGPADPAIAGPMF